MYKCPSCGGEVTLWESYLLPNGEVIHLNRWRCANCHRIWGIGIKKPIFELEG